MDKIKIFDTTLRDGEQSPGCSMNLQEKLEVAKCLEKLGVDVIEAGFAISGPQDFGSVQAISQAVKNAEVASLSRALEKDIDVAWDAVKDAVSPRIHTFIATSPLHMEYKLRMKPEKVLEQAGAMVAYAKKYCNNVEFSAEDATRSDLDFLVRITEIAIANGATVINLPDTVGYTTPSEMEYLIKYVMENAKGSEKAEFSVHCHNDLGMAVANSLAGVQGGARQIECTINGLGERAGNTSMEEVVMAIRTRADMYEAETGINTREIYNASRTVYNIIGQNAPLNKPIVGKNAFAHESGIHQHGVLANKKTYEIMTPEIVGVRTENIVLGKHSGRHAFKKRTDDLGYHLSDEEVNRCFGEFQLVADKKKTVTDADLEAIIAHHVSADEITETEGYKLDWFSVHTSNFTTATCTIHLKKGEEEFEEVKLGDGPIDAAFNAIDAIIQPKEHVFNTYQISSTSEGTETLGAVTVKLEREGRTYTGRGLSTDVIEASIVAYLKALNRLMEEEG